ncbi:hypothetical protein DWB61_08855 [Ancylomarina euxinus]|uniref:Uncharacterized protein n=1 Tax=Ancylomarina euxinus TaxID=2283627 RepID=A0A425Y1T7_9BACT|nr:hypothetical protein [Ancylomarina euxinus]MCZ4695104.1 hypothetical protein [Ancylomarina euxinus]MUP14960.1 hypothetical protein [Ancylomarina euxinus]RRG21852.1 hypothetical protein DWB61_08855 [Ancylomarina euxinus]
MNTELSWEKGTFSSAYTLFKEQKLCGYLKRDSLSQSANGEIKGKVYCFKSSGFIKKNTIVYDGLTYKSLAVISYDEWRSRAILSVDKRVLHFNFDSLFQNSWQLIGTEGELIDYSKSSSKGYINSTTDDSLLLLSGLLVADHYKKSQRDVFVFMMMMACLIIVFTILF